MSDLAHGNVLPPSDGSERVLSDREIKALEVIAKLKRGVIAKLLAMASGREAYFRELFPHLSDTEREAYVFVPADPADVPAEEVKQIPHSATADVYLFGSLGAYNEEAAAIRSGDPDAPVEFYANFYDQIVHQEQAARQ